MNTNVRNYLSTALWANIENDIITTDDCSPALIKQATIDVNTFIQLAGDMLTGEEMPQVMHDLWLTRNGHGAGFWDGDYKTYGDNLTTIAKSMGEVDLYVGDDKKVYAL